MDALALRIANALVGNKEGDAAIEITFSGPTLVFERDAVFALTGAQVHASLDGVSVPLWQAQSAKKGQRLVVGDVAPESVGARVYLAVAGSFAGEPFLGSLATFPLRFGSVDGSGAPLAAGQVLSSGGQVATPQLRKLDEASIPTYREKGAEYTLGVVPGPQEAPDYLTPSDVELLYNSVWTVSDAASRLGVRLIGPKFSWARPSGGEGGSHPSNVIDNAYGIGSINFIGDHAVMLGVDGPSLGGFVCAAVVPSCEYHKLGQLKPGDKIRYRRMSLEEAVQQRQKVGRVGFSGMRFTQGRGI
jgi:urea carboxylase